MNVSLKLAASFLVAVLCACQVAPAATPDANLPAAEADAGPPPTPETYCESTREAFCSYYLRCGRMAVASMEECRSVFMESCNGRYERVYRALADAGKLTLSPSGVAACQAHLASVECSQQMQDLDGACANMWVGTQPAEALCGLGIESLVCAPGNTCVLGLDFCGSCKPAVAAGQTCGDGIACVSGASCTNGTCVARVPPGGACGAELKCAIPANCVDAVCVPPAYVRVGEACSQTQRCPYKSQCISGVCQAQAMNGESCSGAGTCAAGYCGSTNTCIPFKDPGAACAASAECVSGACIMGVCESIPGHCFTP